MEHSTHKAGVVGSIPTSATILIRDKQAQGQWFKSSHSYTNMIKKIKGKYVVLSKTTGRKFGTYNTLKEAKERLRQVEFFKYAKKKGIKLRNKK